MNVAGELFAIIVNLGAVAGNLQLCFEAVKALGVLLRVLVCVVNRCDPLDEKMPEIRYNVL